MRFLKWPMRFCRLPKKYRAHRPVLIRSVSDIMNFIALTSKTTESRLNTCSVWMQSRGVGEQG